MVHRSLRTAHRFRLIAHRFRLTAHRSSLTAHRFPSHRSSLIAHRSSFSAHRSLDANCGESQGFPYSYQSEPFTVRPELAIILPAVNPPHMSAARCTHPCDLLPRERRPSTHSEKKTLPLSPRCWAWWALLY